MCLAVPARVTEIEGNTATIDIMGNTRSADITLLDDVAIGDYVLVHAGFGIQKLDPSDAEETLQIFKSLGEDIDGNANI